MNLYQYRTAALSLLLALLLSGCASGTPEPTSTATRPTIELGPTRMPTAEPAATQTPGKPAATAESETADECELPAESQLAFLMKRNGANEIIIASPGWGLTQLTVNNADDRSPSWSPDNRYLAFASDRDGDYEIYIINLESTELLQLTDNTSDEADPSWSPTGEQLVFRSDRDGNDELYLLNLECVNQPGGCEADWIRLTSEPAEDLTPAWSPDAAWIAFASARDGNLEIYVMSSDGGDVKRLTVNSGADLYPTWSPDGSQLAFQSEVEGNTDIYTIDADGGNRTRMTDDPADDMTPSWSSEGIWLMSSRRGEFDLYLIRNRTRVARPGPVGFEGFDGFPAASPAAPSQVDGCRIPFEVANPAIITALAQPFSDEVDPAWSPDGKWLAFLSTDNRGTLIVIPSACLPRGQDCASPRSDILIEGAKPRDPVWSSDSRELALLVGEGTATVQVFEVAEAGPAQLVRSLSAPAGAADLGWSSEGETFMFTVPERTGGSQIYVMPSAGGEPSLLASGTYFARLSPDGRRIAYVSGWDELPAIVIIDQTGRTLAKVTMVDRYAEDQPPVWSPDGQRLAVVYRPIWELGGPSPIQWGKIYIVNADGTGVRTLSTQWDYHAILSMGAPAWSPDRSQLVFPSDMFGEGLGDDYDLFLISSNGSGLRRLTRGETNDHSPVWSPDGRWIAYMAWDNDNHDIYLLDVELALAQPSD